MKKINILLLLLLSLVSCVDAETTFEKKKTAVMWIDGEANFKRFSNPDSIDYYLKKCRNLGFTDIVVDVRPIIGEVFFKTDKAPMMKSWMGYERRDFDYLGRFIQTGHQLGLKVRASMNCFCAAHNTYEKGLLYSGHSDWASMVYTPQGIVPIMKVKETYDGMVDPLNEDYRKHITGVLGDLIKLYPSLDGVVLDRVRYEGIGTDFSNHSRKLFEEFIGKKLKRFPEDIFSWQKGDDEKYHVQRGQWFKQWIYWRAKNIHDAMVELRQTVKDINSNVEFGTYTGAWYPSYYEVGVNFASNTYDPSNDYDWALPEYKNTGYMELLDFYMAGNYYSDVTIAEYNSNQHLVWNETDSEAQSGTWYCVEGSNKKLRNIFGGHPFCGSVLVSQL
ncbi:MAG: alpha amylase family protein, partial [Prevotella sp.]|nr:alpha amylase family protein [Prevotella sp.]